MDLEANAGDEVARGVGEEDGRVGDVGGFRHTAMGAVHRLARSGKLVATLDRQEDEAVQMKKLERLVGAG